MTTRQQQTAFINSSLRQKLLRLLHLMLILLMGGEIATNKFEIIPFTLLHLLMVIISYDSLPGQP